MARCTLDMAGECRFVEREHSNRGAEWFEFANAVYTHIEDYTVPQYGDASDDQASGFSTRDIVQNMRRYLNRAESGARGLEESKRDWMKVAHYACILWNRMQNQCTCEKGDKGVCTKTCNKNVKQLVDEHWQWASGLFDSIPALETALAAIEYAYRIAFAHGFKHGVQQRALFGETIEQTGIQSPVGGCKCKDNG